MGGKGLSRREYLERCGKGLFCLALTSSPLFEKEVYPSEKGRVGWYMEFLGTVGAKVVISIRDNFP